MNNGKNKVVIIGAGCAGLTAAYKLLKETDAHPVIYEEADYVGGIAGTVDLNGNRMDMGPHRFFSKSREINELWEEVMPLQGERSIDDILTDMSDKKLAANGPDPERQDNVMLLRHRMTRIFFLRKFIDYPLSMKVGTFTALGPLNTLKAGLGYLASCMRKLPETSLENFYINRFGRPLYSMFFEGYTEKVWGMHPSLLDADWGSQRVKGLSISAVLKDMLKRKKSGK